MKSDNHLQASRMYRTGPYFIAKAISEIPLIGVSPVIIDAYFSPHVCIIAC